MTKAYTVREVIDYLSHWQNQEQKVAWLIFTKYDIEGDLEYYEFPSLEEVWNESVDEIQDALNSSWVTEHIAETIREITEEKYPLKENV